MNEKVDDMSPATSQIYKFHGFIPNMYQKKLFHRFVLFEHKCCHALFKHKSHVHNFCV
jgi:hypothetical protein